MKQSVRVKVSGDLALFTRPEMKVERVTYDVISPSAARGVLDAIYFKPQFRWVIEAIRVLNPIQYLSVRRNEVGSKIPAGTVSKAMAAGAGSLGLYVEEDRQQRASTFLRDVAYIIEASIFLRDPRERDGTILTPSAAAAKHIDCFNRRVERGQCFHRPYLGTRECVAWFEPAPDELPPCPEELRGERDLGWMLHDIDFENGMTPRFFRAVMVDGLVSVPRFDAAEVRA